MAVIAKGNAELVINETETEAKLRFIPDAEGLGWDAGAALKLGRDQGINPLPPAADMETFIQKASRAKTPMETFFAEGVLPEPALPERVQWETLAIPGDIAPHKDETLAQCGPPELYKIRTEKVKRNTIVKKPGKFPFMAAREEIVAVWDKKEIRETVEVNPEAKEIRYAGRGNKLGIFEISTPGKPGKNIYGKPMPAPAPGDVSFYLGAGIRREKNELFAETSGFVRIGENWADMVPLAKPDWELNLGLDRVTLFLHFYPGDGRFAVPAGADILEEAKKKVPEDSLIDAGEIDRAIADSMKSGEELLAFPLLVSRASEARVDVTPDLLKAELFLRKGTAGALPLETSRISLAIRESKVQGFNAEELKKVIHTFMEGSDVTLRHTLAQGKDATRGADKEITLLAPPLEAEPRTALLARLKQRKTVHDPRQGFPASEAEQLCIVTKGMKLAEISHPANGEQGVDVYGHLIPGLPGNDPELKLFRGLHQQGDDITADMDGLLLVRGSGKLFWGTIIDYRDSAVSIEISGDAMEARAELVSALGPGLPLTEERVLRALAEAGASKGINREAVETACKLAALKGSAGQVLARGEAPLAAGGMEIRWLIPVRAEGKCSVTPGMVLAEVRQAAENKNGFDVRGGELSAEGTAPRELWWDESVTAAETEPGVKRLSAAQGGELSFDGTKLSVSSLKEISGDVGAVTGNMNFSGELRITGKVSPGYSVMGGRDVFIGGSAEAALISSGGKAVIVQGVKGAGRGVIRARATIETSYAEAATLLAVDDIRVVNRCIACNVKTNGQVLLTGEGGKLAGGICRARRGINAAELGGEEAGNTEVSFGQDYLIKDQIEASERELEKIRSSLAKIDETIKAAATSPARLEAARTEKVRLLKLQEQYTLKIFTLREKFEEHHDSQIVIRGIVHPGVVMESHGRYYEITEKRQGAVFYFNKETGRITEKEL